jgi:hypothetical protein
MHGPINVKSPNNTSKWQMEFNSVFKGLIKAVWNLELLDAHNRWYLGLERLSSITVRI